MIIWQQKSSKFYVVLCNFCYQFVVKQCQTKLVQFLLSSYVC